MSASPRSVARQPTLAASNHAVSTDLELIAALAAQDRAAVPAFYQRYRQRILAVALRHLSDPWDAEEVLQDVVWTVFRKAEGFRGEAEFSSWLYRVTQNCARMLLRKKRRAPIPMQQEDLEPALQRLPGALSLLKPEDAAWQRLRAEVAEAAVDKLDPLNREIFVAAALHGETADEVSQRLGLSTLAVKARLHRVRQGLRASVAIAA